MRFDVHFENDEFVENVQFVFQVEYGHVFLVFLDLPRGLPLVGAQEIPQGRVGLRGVLATERHVAVQHRQMGNVRAVFRNVLNVRVYVVFASTAVRPFADLFDPGRIPRRFFVFRVIPHEYETVCFVRLPFFHRRFR